MNKHTMRVRSATMPENLSIERPIAEVKKRLKKQTAAPLRSLRSILSPRSCSLLSDLVPLLSRHPSRARPIRPSATAAAFLPSSVMMSSISPVRSWRSW